ncbi:MAG: fumarate hydratase C-terminal domain-containing protein [Hyphomicrobiales bacterium]
MATSGRKLETVRLKLPVTTDDLRGLKPGMVVYLEGRIFTAREGVYKKAVEEGAGMPASQDELGNVNFHCSPAATVKPDGTYDMGAVTATASFRFEKWLSKWFEISGCKIIIGKGGMAPETYRDKFVPNGAIYLTTVGYGTGALLGRGVKRVVDTYWRDELGLAQSVWVIDVKNFGPFLVESDLEGNSLFEQENAKIAKNLDGLYKDLKPAIMKRFGETDDRTDEVI